MADSMFFKRSASQPAFSVETPIRAFEPARPYPQNPSAIVYRTRFIQLRAYYTRPVANTPHPNLPQVYFADDVDFQDRTSGMIEWTRVYLTLPDTWSDYESYPYPYPGYYPTPNVTGRPPMVRTTTARLLQEYVIVGTLPNYVNNVASGDNLGTSQWADLDLTKVPNATTIPVCAGGGNYAAFLRPNVTNGYHYISNNSNAPLGPMSASVFLKAGGYTQAEVQVRGVSAFANVSVDLSTGQMIGGNVENATFAAIGDGWWRAGVGISNAPANSSITILVVNNRENQFLGDGTNGIYAWRAQVSPTFELPHATVAPSGLSSTNAAYPIPTPAEVPVSIATQFAYGVVITGPSAGQTIGQSYLSDQIVSNTNVVQVSASIPSLTNYKANVASDTSNTNSYSLEATDSTMSLYQGSIWVRQRRLVKAR